MKKPSYRVTIIFIITINILIIGCVAAFFMSDNFDLSLNQKRNCRKIGLSYMTMNNEFYRIMNEEIVARAESEGDMLILRDPALSSERQQEQINEMLDEGIDVLVVTPVSWQELTKALQRAKNEGVRIIVVDSDVYDEKLVDCTVKSDNYAAGVQVAKYILQDNKKRRFVLMTHCTAKSGIDRIQGFKDTIKGNDNIEIVAELECEGQLEIAEPKMRQFINTGVPFDAVFSLNDLASVGVVAALEESNMLNKVELYGVDASPDAKALIKEDIMAASAAQFPSKIGRSTADVIYKVLNNEPVDKQILVPVELVTKNNIEKYGVDRWQ